MANSLSTAELEQQWCQSFRKLDYTLFKHFLNFPSGLVLHIPSKEEVLSIIESHLHNGQPEQHFVELSCNVSLFETIEAIHDGRLCDYGFLVLKNVSDEVGIAISMELIAAFHVTELYTRHETCPYCGASEGIIELPPVSISLIQFGTQEHNPKFDLIPAYCSHCGIGFNLQDRNDEVYSYLAKTYSQSYISPVKARTQGASVFMPILEHLEKYVGDKEHANLVEFGSYDGYLIKLLIERGYQGVYGFEPNPNFDPALPIFAEPFCREYAYKHFAKESLDAVFSRSAFETIPCIHEILATSSELLKKGGYFFAEVPTPLVVNSLQCFRMSVAFLERCCNDYGMELICVYPDKKPYAINQHTLVIAQKRVNASLESPSDYNFKSIFSSESEKQENLHELKRYSGRLTYSREQIWELKQKLDKCLANKEEVVIYGSGITTGKILTALMEHTDYKDFSAWHIVNSSISNEAMYYHAPNGQNLQIESASALLSKRKVGLVILAVQAEAYKAEILAKLKDLKCSYSDYFFRDYLV